MLQAVTAAGTHPLHDSPVMAALTSIVGDFPQKSNILLLNFSSQGEKLIMKDVFHAFLVQGAQFAGDKELPVIDSCNIIPQRIIPFSKAMISDNYDQFVCFYEPDDKFERFWNSTRKYLPILKKFRGVIGPDFSMYRDMPESQQIWNCYRNRALSFWLQKNGIHLIPNICFSDDRSWEYCYDGLPHHSTVSIGSYGCMKTSEDIKWMLLGLSEILRRLQPTKVVIYGTVPPEMRYVLALNNTPYHAFDGRMTESFKCRRRQLNKNLLFPFNTIQGGT